MAEAKLRHWYKIPDPFSLPVSRFFRLLNRINDIEKLKKGEGDEFEKMLEHDVACGLNR